jgi:hypothetical protein
MSHQAVLYVDDASVLPSCFKFVTEVDASCCQHTPVNVEHAAIHHKCHITHLSSLQKSEIVHSFFGQFAVMYHFTECHSQVTSMLLHIKQVASSNLGCRLLVVMGQDFISAQQPVAYCTVPG